MNGDGDLGGLGGLRIANPDTDEEAVVSPASSTSPYRPPAFPVSPQSLSSETTVTPLPSLLPTLSHESLGQDSSGLGFDPNSYQIRNAPRVQQTLAVPSMEDVSPVTNPGHTHSMPAGHHIPQAAQLSVPVSGMGQPLRSSSVQNTSARPVSSMYMQPNTSSSSSQGSHRYRDDLGSPDGNAAALARTGSQSRRGFMSGSLPQREGSRTYRHGGVQQMNGGNGPLPPRRNSKRVRAPTTESVAPGYDMTTAQHTIGMPMPQSAEEWRDRGAAVLSRPEIDSSSQTQSRIVKKGVKDFNFGRTLGEGSYSTVLAATDRQNLKEYAIKVLDKRHIIKEKKVKYVNIERDTLNRLTEHPGVVRLYYTFQDERSLYFVLDLASGGELLGVLKKLGSFDVQCTRFYGAEILDSIAYMHSREVIHRDLKPENVLLDRDMHVKITDFGTAKILPISSPNGTTAASAAGRPTDGADTDRAMSFVGTAEYVSPELLRDKNACKASDLWAFGCIIYQLLAGRPPFKAANEYLTFQKILALDYSFPNGFPEVARDLIERLLVLEPANRLPVENIKNHRFFEGIQWGKALWRQKAPRLKAYVPPPAEPIRLNGTGQSGAGLSASAAAAAMSPIQTQVSGPQAPHSNGRPQLRGVTELPPPSQLDIDWSPVLTDNNERILKLGNLIVSEGRQSQSPSSKSGEPGAANEKDAKPKFSRFFSGSSPKRRERLVLITSGARLIIAAAGGNEKKAKMEVNFVASGSSWRSFVDTKGLTAWTLDTRDKCITFEDPRGTTADPAGSKYSTQEWLDSLEQAREIAMAINSVTSSYSGDSMLSPALHSSVSSPTDSPGGDGIAAISNPGLAERHHLRQTLRKNTDDDQAGKGRKRFSKRHSKSGLAAVF